MMKTVMYMIIFRSIIEEKTSIFEIQIVVVRISVFADWERLEVSDPRWVVFDVVSYTSHGRKERG